MTTPFDYIPAVLDRAVEDAQPIDVKGKVIQVVGTIIKASVPGVKVGEICILRNPWEEYEVHAEVVGFTKDAALLTALGPMIGISAETEVIPTRRVQMVPVGMNLLGRVLDGLGAPMDADTKGPLRPDGYYPVYSSPPSPLERTIISKPISLGIRAIDGLLTCGEGQRMGIFAAAGGGKSTLLASIIRNTEADVTVLALIGERGREVREFIEKDLGPEGQKRAVLVISTSDRPAMERLKAAYVATSIAESFRDKGKPPTRRGFPPSVFSELPKLMERAGNSSKGSITALYTVLVEGDDMTEPIADETRSILDGHIILSRKLAQQNHYPAIDILASISRCQSAIIPKDHKAAASKLRSLLAKYAEVELLLKIGEYKKGTDPETDEAVAKIGAVNAFLKQGLDEKPAYADTIEKLKEAVS